MDKACVLILAAGASSRFGGIKALAPWQSGTFLSNAISVAGEACGADQVLVVTGAYHAELLPYLSATAWAENKQWSQGMGKSISYGVQEITRHASPEAIVILPVDQPYVKADHLQQLLHICLSSQKIAFTQTDRTHGPPVALPYQFYHMALNLSGETGLKNIIPDNEKVFVHSHSALADIDTPFLRF